MGLKNSKESADSVKVTNDAPVQEIEPTDDVASTNRLNKATELLSRKFNLGEEYVLTGFADKGSSIKVTMSSPDFEVSATIKRPDLYDFEM